MFLIESVPDIPRAFTALAEWLGCIVFIVFNRKRFSNFKTVLISASALIVFALFHYGAEKLPIQFWIPCMIMAAVLMFSFLFTSLKETYKLTINYTITSFIIAEFAAALEWWLYYFFMNNFKFLDNIYGMIGFMVLIYSLVYSMLIILERRYGKEKTFIEWKDLFINLLAAIVVFIVSNISFVDWDTPMTSNYPQEILYIRTLVDFCGVIVLYSAREQRKYSNAKMELNQMHNLLVRQYEQYQISKNTIDSVNRKYHDLKHQLSLLADNSSEKTKKSIAEINKEIMLYETVYKTGNDVLDTIITTKASMCIDKGIKLTCIADGSALSFMDDMDICSIFGNAFDNAIEGTEKIKDLDKKVINVKVYQQNNFLIIKFENYFEGNLLYEGGELQSTKKNKLNHGFGVKSIKNVTEKYGGTVKIDANDNWFSVLAMIPMNE